MKLRFLLIPFVFVSGAVWGQLSFGSAELIDAGWKFALRDEPDARQAVFDDHGWQSVDLPHDWSVKGKLSAQLASCTGYLPGGVGWYRKTLAIPAKVAGEKVYLYFEGIYNRSEVYLNGHLLGKRPNGYVSFYYDATPYVLFDRENVVAVRVDHGRSADSRWYSGSGIYRDVYLVRANPVHIAPWGVFVQPAVLDGGTGRVAIDTEIQNETTRDAPVAVQQELLSADGAVVTTAMTNLLLRPGTSATASQVLEIQKAHLWSLSDPYLYRVRTTVAQDGKETDRALTRTGLRTFTFDPKRGFLLNGMATKMKGVCLHHDAGVLGAAVPRIVWEKRLATLKSLGCNAVRMSHNPQAPAVYDLCDELGLLVLDEAFDEWEFPKRKWLRGWNVGEPGFEGSFDFFQEWSDRDLTDMVRRDRNHVSVFAWSIGNEVDYPNDPYSHPILDGAKINQPMYGGYKPDRPNASRLGMIAKRLVATAKKQDLTRPVTAALAGVVMSNETEYPGALDIVGYNYTEERYAMDHAAFPRRVIYGSENGHSMKAWRAVRDNDYIFGQFLWTGIDYLGEAGPWPSRGADNGLLDFTGAVKPRGRFREALWSDKPVVGLGTLPATADKWRSLDAWPVWNYTPGEKVRVVCFTNAAKVKLLLNGVQVGGEKSQNDETGVVSWEVPFAPGRLEAVALNKQGGESARTVAQTAGEPAELRVTTDGAVIERAGGVATMALQIVDRAGVPVLDSEAEVTCTVEGPGRLLGLEAGNVADVGDYTDAVQRAYHGRLVAYVQATGGQGSVRVRFSVAGLPNVEMTVAPR
ncbi:glycoside hydrolase family 2 [Opitutaceae bacterium EW11]|nr:glycoside hydrolase family 2 [Opitutaceae bacterium EW11]